MDDDADLAARVNIFLWRAAPLIRLCDPDKVKTDASLVRRLDSVLTQLRKPLKNLQEIACANVWSSAGLGTDEVRVSSVLANLWDERLYGGEGRRFLGRCLALLGTDRAPSQNELERGYRIQTEHCPNGDVRDRVDITVETESAIVGIEVKILAGEGERQLLRYLRSIGRRAQLMRRRNAQVMFLSPRAPSQKDTAALWVTWRQIADAASVADRSTSSGSQIHDFGEFCRKLGR